MTTNMAKLWIFLLFLFTIFVISTDCKEPSYVVTTARPCTYFGDSRLSAAEGNLVNCTWYADNACCRRMEVTSVFGGMFPLYGATTECRSHINYMMCYFCSPDQYRWYDKSVQVCADFCRSVYTHCKTAQFHGEAIGQHYTSGQDFCEGQRFEVVEGTNDCFDYDPEVFGGSPQIVRHNTRLMFIVITVMLGLRL